MRTSFMKTETLFYQELLVLNSKFPSKSCTCAATLALARNISAIKSIGDDIGVVLSTLRSKCVQRR